MSDQTPYTPTLDAVANAYSYAMAELAGYDVDDYTDIPEFDRFIAKVKRDAAREALDRAEHSIARLEAQTAIRGRAVVMYRERAREAEARIEAVRDVHTGTIWPGVADKPICDACDQMWPCDTIRALD